MFGTYKGLVWTYVDDIPVVHTLSLLHCISFIQPFLLILYKYEHYFFFLVPTSWILTNGELPHFRPTNPGSSN